MKFLNPMVLFILIQMGAEFKISNAVGQKLFFIGFIFKGKG